MKKTYTLMKDKIGPHCAVSLAITETASKHFDTDISLTDIETAAHLVRSTLKQDLKAAGIAGIKARSLKNIPVDTVEVWPARIFFDHVRGFEVYIAVFLDSHEINCIQGVLDSLKSNGYTEKTEKRR